MIALTTTRLVAIADLHGTVPAELPDGDVLAIVGDLCDYDRPKRQLEWLKRRFVPWLRTLPFERILLVAGNHDFWAALPESIWRPHLPDNVDYLLDRTVELRGLKFHGAPWTPRFEDWAFQDDDDALAERWRLIPDDVDVVLSHGPPWGACDFVPPDRHAGSRSLRVWVDRVQPPLVVCGHIHEAAGFATIGRTTVVNVSLLGGQGGPGPFNRPAVFELSPGSARAVLP